MNTRIALKPYLETITKDCSGLSKQELTQIILGLAKDELTSRRVPFLQKFQSLLSENGSKDTIVSDTKTILSDIQALKESIVERIEAIENCDYEQLDDWDWEDYHDDDEPDYVNDEQMEDLAILFQDAENLFLNDQIEGSRALYAALFNLIDEIDDYRLIQSELEVDIREERARYARCVYDTSDENKRLDEFAATMTLDASNRYGGMIDESYPLFQDVIDAREEEMADLQSFYGDWKKFLANKGINGRPASLLIEVVNHLEGIEGVVKLARTWQNDQPYGYLFWLTCLKQKNRLDDIVEVSKEALQVLKAGNAREKISELLIEVGELSGTRAYVLEGKREKFFSNLCDNNLLALQNEAVVQDKRDEELESVLVFFVNQKGMEDKGKSLYLKSLLMAGRLDDAFVMVKQSESIGWSYGLNIGLVFGAVAIVVADYAENAGIIGELLAGYAGRSAVYSYQMTVNEVSNDITFYNEIIKGIQKIEFPKSKLAEYFDWALTIGRNRIDHIVSNQHRGAYKRASQVLGTLAEVYTAKGDVEKAEKIIHEYCKEKYNRHSAFKREVKMVVSHSKLLQNINISV
ncbi:hypothetical protein [Desulfobacula sp.]